jgi:hypothetical protein
MIVVTAKISIPDNLAYKLTKSDLRRRNVNLINIDWGSTRRMEKDDSPILDNKRGCYERKKKHAIRNSNK